MKRGPVETKDTLTTLAVILPVLLLSYCSSTVTAMPPSVSLRSADNNHAASTQPERQMHLADGFLCELMMERSDANGDERLSEAEITWFYQHFVLYTPYVASIYGREFISIADLNGDSLLDRNELLRMLVEMNASDWTRR